MKLTLGMATYDDYDGVYFTIQAIRTYHPEVLSNLEVIVVDNNPGTKTSEAIQNLLDPKRMGKGIEGRYIAMPEATGTTQPRNRIFQEATGDAVLCIDSHVLLSPGSLAKLINYYEVRGGSRRSHRRTSHNRDILSGPILYDDFSICGDHFADYWRSQMWGIWGKVWKCRCSNQHFTVINTNNQCGYHRVKMGFDPIDSCQFCDCPPSLPYSRHEDALLEHGCTLLANGSMPYEIPGMGLGLFSMRREAWPGFNEHFRGFGGEEMYIHEKVRQRGGRALCLPWLKWGHRFARPNGTPYLSVCTVFNKVRNYILGHMELGLDLTRCHQHFVGERIMSPQQWAYIMNDPIGCQHPSLPPENRVERGSNTLQEASNAR